METLTKPEIIAEILESFQSKVEEEKQVIVHCCYPATVALAISCQRHIFSIVAVIQEAA